MASTLTLIFGESTDVLISTGINVKINIGGSSIIQRLETFSLYRKRNGFVAYPDPYSIPSTLR